MTENKRYELKEYSHGLFVQDNENNKVQYYSQSNASMNKIVDLLNEQEELIQELETRNKRQYERLKEKEEYCDNICKSFEDYYGMNIENAEWFGFNGDVE